MSVDYNTYVGPFLRIQGDARAFFNETHVDELISIQRENCPEIRDDETLAITNYGGLGFYADRETLRARALGLDAGAYYTTDFQERHGEHMRVLREMGCELSLGWGVISWAS